MRILAADDDVVFRRLLAGTLGRLPGHELTVVEDGKRALECAGASPAPALVILDWLMPELSGTQVCRELRARGSNQHVIIVTGRGRREEILECLKSGADDVLIKPVAPDLLAAKVERARARYEGSARGPEDVREALRDAAFQGDGELVIGSWQANAHVYMHEGQIAWVEVADGSPTFLQLLIDRGAVEADAAQDLVDECRRTGASATDIMVEWGLMERAALRECLSEWLREELTRVLALPDAHTLFLHQKRRFQGSMVFPLEEVLPDGPAHALRRSIPSPEGAGRPSLIPNNDWEQAFVPAPAGFAPVEALLERCMEGDGVLGVAAFDPGTGYCLGRRGVALNPDAAWAHIQVITTMQRLEPVMDSVVCTEDHYHMVRMVPGTPAVCIYVMVDAQRVLLAYARIELERASQGV